MRGRKQSGVSVLFPLPTPQIKKESPNEGTETITVLLFSFQRTPIKKESPNEGTETRELHSAHRPMRRL